MLYLGRLKNAVFPITRIEHRIPLSTVPLSSIPSFNLPIFVVVRLPRGSVTVLLVPAARQYLVDTDSTSSTRFLFSALEVDIFLLKAGSRGLNDQD